MKACFFRALVVLGFSLLLTDPFRQPLHAQRGQPIYPAYDGFVKNPDGSFTLSFAYFSHNAEPVTIPPDASNSFEPAPTDRQQPTTFLPGHWRFQCVMVVGPEFDGKLRWTLLHAGTSTGTSQNMLQYSWELDAAAGRQALRAIDPGKVPRGVCLNRPLIVRVLGLPVAGRGSPPAVLSVAVSEELRLFGSVTDEGLPRGAQVMVSWKQLSGPGTVKFTDPSKARTLASFSTPGAYELELWASDSVLEDRTRIAVTVRAAPALK